MYDYLLSARSPQFFPPLNFEKQQQIYRRSVLREADVVLSTMSRAQRSPRTISFPNSSDLLLA